MAGEGTERQAGRVRVGDGRWPCAAEGGPARPGCVGSDRSVASVVRQGVGGPSDKRDCLDCRVAPYKHPSAAGSRERGVDGRGLSACGITVKAGAGERTRTADLLITNQLLYQLSYAGTGGKRGLAGTSGGGHPAVSESRTGRRAEPGRPRGDDAGTASGSPSLPPYCSWLRCGVHDRRGLPSLAGSAGGGDGPRRLGRRRRGHGDGCGRASRWHWTQLSTMVM